MPLPKNGRRHNWIFLGKFQKILITRNQVVRARNPQRGKHLLIRIVTQSLLSPFIGLNNISQKHEAVH